MKILYIYIEPLIYSQLSPINPRDGSVSNYPHLLISSHVVSAALSESLNHRLIGEQFFKGIPVGIR